MEKGPAWQGRLAASPLATLVLLVLLLFSGGERLPLPEPETGGSWESLTGRVIVVDPGHGGSDPSRGDVGAEGIGPTTEKENALNIGLALRRELEALGARVVMTREEDRNPAEGTEHASDPLGQLKVRVETARQADADAFISIHNDWNEDPSQEGAATFYYGARSQELAEAVQKELVRATGAEDRGIQEEGFYVLRNTPGRAVLVETGFVSHAEEAYRLADPVYQARIARGIAQGLVEVLGR